MPAIAMEEDPGPRRYLDLLERAAAAVDVPVIASLNGATPEGWTGYARSMQDAGAAAIELNIYYVPGDPRISGRDVEQRHVEILSRVKQRSPCRWRSSSALTSAPPRARDAPRRGRAPTGSCCSTVSCSQTSIPSSLPSSRGSTSRVRPMHGCHARGSRCCEGASAPRWRPRPGSRCPPTSLDTCSRAPTSVMTTSALLRHGPEYASELLDGLSAWMTRKGFDASMSCAACSRCRQPPISGVRACRLCRGDARSQRWCLRSLVGRR